MSETAMIEEVDLEEYAKAGKPVPVARRYRLRIDKEHKVSTTVSQKLGSPWGPVPVSEHGTQGTRFPGGAVPRVRRAVGAGAGASRSARAVACLPHGALPAWRGPRRKTRGSSVTRGCRRYRRCATGCDCSRSSTLSS
jgi:hypothetical protein